MKNSHLWDYLRMFCLLFLSIMSTSVNIGYHFWSLFFFIWCMCQLEFSYWSSKPLWDIDLHDVTLQRPTPDAAGPGLLSWWLQPQMSLHRVLSVVKSQFYKRAGTLVNQFWCVMSATTKKGFFPSRGRSCVISPEQSLNSSILQHHMVSEMGMGGRWWLMSTSALLCVWNVLNLI